MFELLITFQPARSWFRKVQILASHGFQLQVSKTSGLGVIQKKPNNKPLEEPKLMASYQDPLQLLISPKTLPNKLILF